MPKPHVGTVPLIIKIVLRLAEAVSFEFVGDGYEVDVEFSRRVGGLVVVDNIFRDVVVFADQLVHLGTQGLDDLWRSGAKPSRKGPVVAGVCVCVPEFDIRADIEVEPRLLLAVELGKLVDLVDSLFQSVSEVIWVIDVLS